ncbi:translocation/assembly module TamB domain-containing protein [Celeribacter sp. ULVN23_4]
MKKLLPITVAATLPLALVAQDNAQDTATQDDTNRDRSMIVGFLEDNLSGGGRDIRIEGFKGLLSSTATMEEMTISDAEGTWFTLRDAELEWSRKALLSGRVEVTKITAGEIILDRLPETTEDDSVDLPDPEATPFSLPELPVSIDIGQIEAERVRLGAPVLKLGEPVELSLSGSAKLADGSGSTALEIQRIDGTEGNFSVDVSYTNETEVLDLDISLKEGPGGIVSTLGNLPGSPSLALVAKGAGPLDDFAADLSLATNDTPRLTGKVSLTAEPDPEAPDAPAPRRFAANLSGDLTPLFSAEYARFFGPSSTLDAQGLSYPEGGFDLDRFTLSTQTLSLVGATRIAADGLPSSFSVSGTLDSIDDRPVLLPFGDARSQVDHAKILAEYDAEKAESWTAQIDMDGYTQDGLSIGKASVEADGTISRKTVQDTETGSNSVLGAVTAKFALALQEFASEDTALQDAVGSTPALTGSVAWEEGQPFQIESLIAKTDATKATVTGDINGFDAGFEFTGDLSIDTPRLARFSGLAGRDLSGTLSAKASGSISPLNGTFDLTAEATGSDLRSGIAQLDALTDGKSTVSIAARRDGTGLTLRKADITTPALSVRASGALKSDSGALSLDAKLDDVARLEPNATGPLSLTLNMSHTGAETPWSTAAQVTGPGNSTVALSGLLSTGQEAQASEDTTSEATTTDETAAQGELAFTGDLDIDVAELATFAGLVGQDLSGALKAKINGSVTPLAGYFDATVDATGTDLRSGIAQVDALTRGESTVSLIAKRDETGITVQKAEVATPALEASAKGTLLNDSGDFTFDAKLDDVARLGMGLSGPLTVAADITRANAQSPWETDATVDGPGGSAATLSGSLTQDLSTADLTLKGTAPLGLANSFTTAVVTQGTSAFDLSVKGPLALSSVSGQVQLQSGARIIVSAANLALAVDRATVSLNGEQAQVDFLASADSGGSISTSGSVGLSGSLPANLAIGLNDLGLTDSQLYSTSIDGDLTVIGGLTGGANIAGALTLGETEVNIATNSFGSGGDVPDIIHRGASAAVTETRDKAGLIAQAAASGSSSVAYGLDISINAPGKIYIRGRGLDTELGGRLRVRGTTADIVPVGQFSLLRGRMSLMGKRIVMEEGYVTLQGELDPVIRLVAETETDDLTVQLITEGTVSSPELTLSSSPEMPEDEILAQLLFGKSISEISAFQAAQMASAVATLTGNGGGLVGSIRDSFGLDDLDVQTSEEGDTSLKVGKYLTENIYTDVTVDSAGTSEINLNYDVTKNITLKGTTSSDGDSSIGAFFEKDY